MFKLFLFFSEEFQNPEGHFNRIFFCALYTLMIKKKSEKLLKNLKQF